MTIVQEIWVTDHGTVIRATDEGARRIIPGIAAKMEQLKCQRSIWLSTDAGVTAKHTHVPFRDFEEAWGYTHPLEGGDIWMWIDPYQDPAEREETEWHECLHVAFPKHPEDWIAKEAKKRSHAEKPV